jgi:hypothetical protein
MKKITYALMFLFIFCFFNSKGQSTCDAVTLELIHPVPQNGLYNYWGVKVSISQPYHVDITVSGTIYQEGQQYVDGWQLTITSGNLSAETSVDYYQTGPATTAEASISSVSACPQNSGGLDQYWQSELDNIGIIHNQAMEYAFQQLQQENLSNLTETQIHQLTASYISIFYTNRYGQTIQFNQNDLYNEILNKGVTPPSPSTLSISSQLLGVVNSILDLVDQTQSPVTFENEVNFIVNQNINQLQQNEQLYLIAFQNLVIASFEYWTQNSGAWDQLFQNTLATADNNRKGDLYSFTEISNIITEEIQHVPEVNETGQLFSLNHFLSLSNESFSLNLFSSCRNDVIKGDAKGVISGAVSGCIGGSLFGAAVGCAAAGIFWGGVQGAVGSLSSAILCRALQ